MEIHEDPIKYIKIYIIACILPNNDHKSHDVQIKKCIDNLHLNNLHIR